MACNDSMGGSGDFLNSGGTWAASPIELMPGVNTIYVGAIDDKSNIGTAFIAVTYSPVTTPAPQEASVTVTSSSSTSTYGQAVTFTATMSAVAPASGTPTGTATFYDGATQISSPVTLTSGTATFTTSALNVAIHTITAVYSGDPYFDGNTGAMFQTLNQAVLTVTADSENRAYGAANPSLSYILSGFVNGDTSSVVSGAQASRPQPPRPATPASIRSASRPTRWRPTTIASTSSPALSRSPRQTKRSNGQILRPSSTVRRWAQLSSTPR